MKVTPELRSDKSDGSNHPCAAKTKKSIPDRRSRKQGLWQGVSMVRGGYRGELGRSQTMKGLVDTENGC